MRQSLLKLYQVDGTPLPVVVAVVLPVPVGCMGRLLMRAERVENKQ